MRPIAIWRGAAPPILVVVELVLWLEPVIAAEAASGIILVPTAGVVVSASAAIVVVGAFPVAAVVVAEVVEPADWTVKVPEERCKCQGIFCVSRIRLSTPDSAIAPVLLLFAIELALPRSASLRLNHVCRLTTLANRHNNYTVELARSGASISG